MTAPQDWPPVLTAADIKRLLRWGDHRIQITFNRPDFPLVDRSVKRNRQVTADALWAWMNRGIKHGD